ncbi:MAG: hypothetical protein RLZZ168_1529, partial [Cyanobacteriota bacterium]
FVAGLEGFIRRCEGVVDGDAHGL